jgi:acetyltransferase-like isoleucine patch superfamily enzyme
MKRIKNFYNYILYLLLKCFASPFKLKSKGKLVVGKMSYHNGTFRISGDQNIKIGNYCAFGKNINIITSNHDYNYPSIQGTFYNYYFNNQHPGILKIPPNKERTKGDVEIGSDVWISHNVTILSGVKIGNGACIANNSVITRDVPPFAIVAGIPARVIKMRFSQEMIDFLLLVKWWEWTEDQIKRNKVFFSLNLNRINVNDLKQVIKYEDMLL